VALSKIYLNYTVLMYGIVVALRERSAIDANCHIKGRKNGHCSFLVVIGRDDF
jgi:hypothetical protein